MAELFVFFRFFAFSGRLTCMVLLNADTICNVMWCVAQSYISRSSYALLNSKQRRKKQDAFIATLLALCSRKDTVEYKYMMDLRMRVHFITHVGNTRTILLSDFLKNGVNVLLRRCEIAQYCEFYYRNSLCFSILFRNKSTACIRSMTVMFDTDTAFAV